MKNTLQFLALAGFTAVSSVHGATVVYNFTGDTIETTNTDANLTSSATSNDFGAGVSVTDISLIRDNGRISITDGHGFGTGDIHAYLSNREEVQSVSFTITVEAGYVLDLTNLDFYYGTYATNTGNLVESIYTVTSSQGSISAGGTGSIDNTDANGGAINTLNADDFSHTLSGLTGLTDTSVTFTWDLTTNPGVSNAHAERGHVMDNFVLTGTVAPIPEPSSTALLGLGGLALILRRRK